MSFRIRLFKRHFFNIDNFVLAIPKTIFFFLFMLIPWNYDLINTDLLIMFTLGDYIGSLVYNAFKEMIESHRVASIVIKNMKKRNDLSK